MFNVVKSPFAVKFPPTTKLPLISPFPFTSNPVAVIIPAFILSPVPPTKGPSVSYTHLTLPTIYSV